ncbi:TIGR03503 family protein [Colwellia sp. E2M01]|uniref:TIGR03503 family protein n=1 Tax=Colwellia sp. E2M01 TaxID=2841561 RepID=UPI001C09DD6A|nr:TIGR03503 family protein [Colwellia sp. E2M01]MBU2871494.1 TIGR03503 family protein [Colwellia sp. E2M01]
MEINKPYCLHSQLITAPKLTTLALTLMLSCNVYAFFTGDTDSNNNLSTAVDDEKALVITKDIIKQNNVDNKLSVTEVEYYQKDNITNQIPYFDNRFRLDANLDEITLIFYRKSGSTPIILIRPDGSKIRVNNFDKEKVQWFDDSTFDMIKIKKPMPGPWQAVGDILPESQILIVSDVKILVEPLPDIVFSGETLKVRGNLTNGNVAINPPYFKDVVQLDVNFYSTNNPLYDNFSADAIKLTSFRDDGYELDEYANDNIFTGEFILDFAAGEWQPVYLVNLPMATRELKQTPILLQENPIEVSVVKSELAEQPHQVILTIDPSFVDPNSLVFQGKLMYPDRQTENFSVMEEKGEVRVVNMENTEPGIYRINVSAFGKTITGREFRLVVPEFSINIEQDPELAFEQLNLNTEEVAAVDENALNNTEEFINKLDDDIAQTLATQQQKQTEKEQQTIILIVAANIVIITIGLIMFFMFRRKK